MGRIDTLLGDITQVKADAIVNAANCTLLGGGGVDGAIHRAAGPMLLAECRGLGGCETGKAPTPTGYTPPCRSGMHTRGPIWHGGGDHEKELLASCYRSCVALAEEYGLHTLAFPSISTGVYRFPLDLAAPIAVAAVRSALRPDTTLEEITFVCFDERTKAAYDRALAGPAV